MKSVKIAAIALVVLLLGYFLLKPAGYPITNAQPTGRTVVCFGDSLTYGTGAARGSDYPSRLAGMLGEPVINLGVPGDTTGDALARIDQVLEQEPRIVLLTLGGNDLKLRVPKETAFANLRAIIGKIQQQGALVVIGGLEIPLFGSGYNDGYRQLARETGSLLVENVFDGIMGDAGLMSDKIHPNAEGYAVMAKHFHEVLEPYVR